MIIGRKFLVLLALLAIVLVVGTNCVIRGNSPVVLSNSNVSGGSSLSSGPQTSPSTGSEGPMISMTSGQALASATVFDSKSRAVGVDVQLWRFPDGDGAPQLESESTTDSSGTVSLYDLSLLHFDHADPYVHYRVAATQFDSVDPSLPVKSAAHDWSSLTKDGLVQTRTVTLKLQPTFVIPSHSSASSTTSATVSPNNVKVIPQEQGCGATTSHVLKTWTQVWTVIGEVHSTTGMTNHFEYSSGSGSSLTTMLAVGYNQWQVQSGVTKTNTIGWQSGFGTISSPTQSAYVKSMFDYQETYLDNSCHSWNYQISVSAYDGGAQFGDHIPGDNSCPPIGAAYAGAPTGSSFTGSSSQSVTYTNSVSLGAAYDSYGGTTDTVTLTDTTVYTTSTLIQATFGTQHSTYYAYAKGGGVPTNTNLQVYFSNSGACGNVGLSANPPALTFPSGSSGTSTITLTSQGGFADPLSMTTSASPGGSTVSYSPPSVTLTNGGIATTTVSISTLTSLAGGSYYVVASAGNGDLSSSVTIPITIQDFGMSSSPSFVTIYPGTSGTSTITLNSINGYSGGITFSPPNLSGMTVSFSPTTVSIPSGGSAVTTMTIIVANNAQTGTYPIAVTGSGGFASRVTTITVQVPDFSLSSSPTSLPIVQGGSATSSVSLTSMNNFVGSITLTATSNAPSGLTTSFSQTSVTLVAGGSGLSTLTVNVASSVPVGTYTVTVTGSNGGIAHNWYVSVTVSAVPFSVSTNPTSVSVWVPTQTSSQITVVSLSGFSGSVTLSSAISNPSGLSMSFGGSGLSSQTLSVPSGGSASTSITIGTICGTTSVGNYVVIFTSQSASPYYSVSTSVQVSVPSAQCGSGGSGSLARGTLITMSNGSSKLVQRLNVGDQLLGYDPSTGQYGVSTVTSVQILTVHTRLVIHTLDGKPLITDASNTEILWTKRANGQTLWLPVTQIVPGDMLWTQSGWDLVTRIDSISGGSYTVYDITATTPYFANGYLDPPNPS